MLDLFAGSGAIGLEALSRDASNVIFIDNNKICCDIIKQNITLLGFASRAIVIKCDILKTELWEKKVVERFGYGVVSLVFADPPYGFGGVSSLPGIIAGSPVISKDARLVFEHGSDVEMPDHTVSNCRSDAGNGGVCGDDTGRGGGADNFIGAGVSFEKYKEKSYRGTCISIYRPVKTE